MRGSAIWLADQLADAPAGRYDLLFTCDMTSVADLKALLPVQFQSIPIICYFHENQLTYPLSPNDWRDFQFGFTNITSALAADAVWFNSKSHMNAFLEASGAMLKTMPENLAGDVLPKIAAKSSVQYPPVESPPNSVCGTGGADRPVSNGPLRILWPHRWEYDKNPRPFFDALLKLQEEGAEFELVMLGESFRTAPPEFKSALSRLESHVHHAGFLPKREDYWGLLQTCDVVVSTAIQENFGLAVVEAMLASCVPVLPNRLSYPELLAHTRDAEVSNIQFLYDDDTQLKDILRKLCKSHVTESSRTAVATLRVNLNERFGATLQVPRLDASLAQFRGH